ncbi:MAG: isoprenyl transferase [Lachnospiraceae bacterium]|nr:isoprenyl transferase [Lachnospiraceae bacterium]
MGKETDDLAGLVIPNHVAIILDGNGRWAKKRFLPRSAGHSQGAKNVEQICDDAGHMGIRYLTVYAFSTENWKRSDSEVATLMNLLRDYLKDCIRTADKNNLRVRVIGERSRLDADMQESIARLEEASAHNDGLNFTIALNYGSRDEIRRAVTRMLEDCRDGKLTPEEVTEEKISSYLDTAGLPDPDLLIRTSGEERLSNYLLWQIAYSELYFTDTLWPDFKRADLVEAIKAYNQRERRFGGR